MGRIKETDKAPALKQFIFNWTEKIFNNQGTYSIDNIVCGKC